MGIKLVYYKIADGRLTFGSEIRAVLAAEPAHAGRRSGSAEPVPEVPLHAVAADDFQGHSQARSGHDAGRRRRQSAAKSVGTTTRRFRFRTTKSDEEATRELLDLYKGAVKRHLLSDVPVGILLSGGLDSGLLLALMQEHGRDWPAYTVGYGKTFEDDELADAAETAALLGGRHVPVQLDRREFERSLPTIVSCLEEPIASSSIVPMYFVCQRAREDVKVALIGQGPDELFCGYKRHLGIRYGDVWRKLPRAVRQADRLGRQPAAAQRNGEAGRLRARDRGPARALSSTSSRSRRRNGSPACFAAGLPPNAFEHVESWTALLPEIGAPRRARPASSISKSDRRCRTNC